MTRLVVPCAVALTAAAACLAQPLTYVRVTTSDGPALAHRLEHAGHDVVEGGIRERSVELMLTAEELADFRRQGYSIEVISESRPLRDIQNEQNAGLVDVPPGYPTLQEIYDEMSAAAAAFPAICKMVDVTAMVGGPNTHGGRHLYAMKISDNVNADEDEPTFLLVSGHHAREIVTNVIALDTIARLTTGYATDPAIAVIVNKYEVWVMPTANPDGYDYMFNTNNNWRKNRRANTGGSFGVDQNRNYPQGWNAPCDGSTNPASDTYKGPSAGSEPETQVVMAFSNNRHLTKVLDYHSFGRETLYAYQCLTYPLTAFMQSEAIALSTASGYLGHVRVPSAEGEEQEWQMAVRGSHAFLTETHTSFQPSYASAQAEAAMVWGGTLWLMQRAIPVVGHVRNSVTNQPVVATISYQGIAFANGEKNASEPRFGRYHAFLPAGVHTLQFSAPGYVAQNRLVTVTANTEQVFDIQLDPIAPPCYPDCNADGALNLADFGCFQTRFATGNMYADCNADLVLNLADFGCFQTRFALGCP